MPTKTEITEYLSAMNRAHPDLSAEDFRREVLRITKTIGNPKPVFYKFLNLFCCEREQKKSWDISLASGHDLKPGSVVRPRRTRCVKWRIGEIEEIRISQKKALVKITHEADLPNQNEREIHFPKLRSISLAQILKI